MTQRASLSASRLSAISFNVLSAKQSGRISDIHSVFARSHFVGLQGLRIAAEKHHAIQYAKIKGFHMYTAGFTKASNEHAGVSVSISDLFPLKAISQVAWPNCAKLAGRGIMVRVRTESVEVTVFSVY